MGLVVLHPGSSATIQDRGRPGYREFGVPVGGAADLSSFLLANALLGNDPDDAAIELTLTGGRYRATTPLALALAGAPMAVRLERSDGLRRVRRADLFDGGPSSGDGPHGGPYEDRGTVALSIPQSFLMEPGDELVLGGTPRGLRAYLAARGGWLTPPILGSRSSETRLVAGRELAAAPGSIAVRRPRDVGFPDPTDGPIRLLDGPDGPVPPSLLEHTYRVAAASDRAGIRLEGPPLGGVAMPDRPSAPVAPGAVQIAGDRALILDVAGGTMGGYPHVAHVITADLDRLGQAAPGVELRFARIDLDEARRLDRERRALLSARDRRIALAVRD